VLIALLKCGQDCLLLSVPDGFFQRNGLSLRHETKLVGKIFDMHDVIVTG
jgi:hypothetical protein